MAAGLDRFLAVPAGAARYDTDATAAALWLCTLPEYVIALGEKHGLPFVCDAERGPLFERADLINVGLMSGSGRTTLEVALRFALGFSAGPAEEWLGARDWLVTVRLPAEETGRHRVRVPDVQAPGVRLLPSQGLRLPAHGAEFDHQGHQAAVRITGARGRVRDVRAGEVYREMLADLFARRVVYQCVAEPLRMDHHRAWEAGMADCIVVSRVITDRLRAVGLRARARRGYLLGVVASEHAWCEVWEDGRWKPVDVGLAFIPRRFPGGQDFPETREFTADCFGSRLNRLLPCVGEGAGSLLHDTVADEPLAMFGLISGTHWRVS
ncbi:transglutaminase domain-containing protein [Streptomyces sp. NPDC006450]|uniref:transglutaminase domain-containing protein n=1 Tax=Streptomyces sp. NPDC006450 TaxID=3155458 RepID=UPI0033AA30B5